MSDIATFFVTGRITADPEYATTQSGVTRLSFAVASNYNLKNRTSGEWEQKTTWFRFTAWEKKADFLAKKLFKGMTVTVSGNISMQEREGKQEYVFRAYEIVPPAIPRDMWLNPPKPIQDWLHQRDGANYQPEPSSGVAPRPSRPAPAPASNDFVDDEDLPF